MGTLPSGPPIVTVAGTPFRLIREGLADILVPDDRSNGDSNSEMAKRKTTRMGGEVQSVFYNPIQQFNRDLSVLAIKVFAEEIVAERQGKQRKRAHSRDRNGNGKSGKGWRAGDAQATAASAGETAGGSGKRKRDERDELDEGTERLAMEPEAKKLKANSSNPTEQSPLKTAVEAGSEERGAECTQMSPPTHAAEQRSNGTEDITSNDKTPKQIPFRILDALSATGLRALRYAKEVPNATLITANDLSREAVASIRRNIEHNDVKSKVHAIEGNATGHMYYIGSTSSPKLPDGSIGKYDVIDLDPYGTAGPFLDAAVQAISNGGLLCVTCTDSAVFASVGYLEKTFSQYGGIPWKGPQSHEAGLRLIVYAVAVSAARYGLAIEPLLSLSIDYYTRTFIRVRRSPNEVKLFAGKTLTVYNCDTGCGAWTKQYSARTTARENRNGEKVYHFTAAQAPTAMGTNCEHCGFKTHMVGPMWGGPLHNPSFVQRMLERLPGLDKEIYGTIPRLEGMLDGALHETLLPPNIMKVTDKSTESGVDGKETGTASTKTSTILDAKDAAIVVDGLVHSTNSDQHVPLPRLDPALPEAHPFFVTPPDLARVLRCVSPSDAALRGALKGLGYRVTRSHTKPGSIRTDAPWNVIWDVMREWVRTKAPIKEGSLRQGMAGWRIMQRPDKGSGGKFQDLEGSLRGILGDDEDKLQAVLKLTTLLTHKDATEDRPADVLRGESDVAQGKLIGNNNVLYQQDAGSGERGKEQEVMDEGTTVAATGEKKKIVFDESLGRDTDKRKIVRYQVNPRENWGPQSRAK